MATSGLIFDCVIVGGGVIGCFAARELARYRGRFLLVEAGNDVAVGTSKANSGIVHAGFDAKPGTLKAKYNVAGAALMAKKCGELEVPYRVNGALVLDITGDRAGLDRLKARAVGNGVKADIVTGDEARTIEPGISPSTVAALYAPTSGIVSPYELTVACYENFISNGGAAYKNTRVVGISREDGMYVLTAVSGKRRKKLCCRTVINAAGLFATDISAMVGAHHDALVARRGQYVLLDKTAHPVDRTVFRLPTAMGKGVLVAPTCHGNTLVGPNAEDIDCRTDVATTADGLSEVLAAGAQSVPGISSRDIITQFSGVRAIVGHDFSIGEAEDGFFEAVGVSSPGLASSPAIAEYLAGAVAQKLGLDESIDFDPHRAAIPYFAGMTNAERDALIAADSRYGKIVCRCECVTEGEIIEAVHRGAVDLDGVKRRVRAGMGRCQAGFCTPRLIELIARERGIKAGAVTKRGGDSALLR